MSEETQDAVKPAVTGIETVYPPRKKFFVAEETKTLRNGDVEAYVSTEGVDRMGDIIKAKGWQLDAYRKSGSPVLFGHDQDKHIGNAVELEVQRKGLWSVTRFHEKTQMSREAAILARERLMPGWSVGFQPVDKPEDRMVDGKFMGYIYTKQELLEYSLVSVPANPEAVSKAFDMVRRGLINDEMIERFNLSAIFAGPSPLAEEDGEETERILEHLRARSLASYLRSMT
jgi:HK97 family phage prohead protease